LSASGKELESLASSEHDAAFNASNSVEDSVAKWMKGADASVSQASAPLSDSLAVTIGGLIRTTKDNRWSIIAIMIIGCLAGVFKAISETPVYQASLTMAVEPSSRNSRQSLFDPYAYRFYETQYELLKSRSVASRVVDELELVERESVDRLLVPPSTFRSTAIEFEKLTGLSLIANPEVVDQGSKAELSDEQKQRKHAWLTRVIQGGVNVDGGDKTNLVSVTFNSINPQFAAEIANALVSAYIDEGLESQLNRSQQTTQWYAQRIEDLRDSLNESQAELQQFLIAEKLLGVSKTIR